MRTYTTVQGDLWDDIAHKQLGSAAYVDQLMNANTQYLHYYIFPAGIMLTLPDVTPSALSSELPPWKRSV